jgi:hypothetical protein
MAPQYYSALTEQMYIAYLGRPAENRGLQAFSNKLDAAATTAEPLKLDQLARVYMGTPALVDLLTDLANSEESIALYGANTPLDTYVNSIFIELFNRPAKAAGLAYWVSQISEGKISRAAAPMEIMAGAYANTTDVAQSAIDRAVVANKTSVALHFTASIDTIDELIMYRGPVATQSAHDMLHTVTSTTDVPAFQSSIDDVLYKLTLFGYAAAAPSSGETAVQADLYIASAATVDPHVQVTLVGIAVA